MIKTIKEVAKKHKLYVFALVLSLVTCAYGTVLLRNNLELGCLLFMVSFSMWFVYPFKAEAEK